MNLLLRAARKTQPVYDIASGLFTGPGAIGLAFLPLVLGVTTTAFLGFVATETGRAILDEVRRRGRPAAPRPAAPSLRGAPTAAELASDCETSPRTLAVRLRLGSRLADLEPTLERGLKRKTGRMFRFYSHTSSKLVVTGFNDCCFSCHRGNHDARRALHRDRRHRDAR